MDSLPGGVLDGAMELAQSLVATSPRIAGAVLAVHRDGAVGPLERFITKLGTYLSVIRRQRVAVVAFDPLPISGDSQPAEGLLARSHQGVTSLTGVEASTRILDPGPALDWFIPIHPQVFSCQDRLDTLAEARLGHDLIICLNPPPDCPADGYLEVHDRIIIPATGDDLPIPQHTTQWAALAITVLESLMVTTVMAVHPVRR